MRNRFIYSDNNVLEDFSVNLNDYHSGTHSFTFVAAEDAFYWGQRVPFNHGYIVVNTANTASTTLTIQTWDGSTWRDAYETIDETEGLTQSGFITWVTNKERSWQRESTNDRGSEVTGLTDLNIYDLYWIKMTYSNDLDAGTELSFIGNKFATDDDLGSEYPDLVRSNVLTAFESGKTTWDEQHIRTAEIIIRDLVSKGVINDSGEIIVREDLMLAAVSKCAQLIYAGLGDDYLDQKLDAFNEYKYRIDRSLHRVDRNSNARLDDQERLLRAGQMYR